MPRPAVPPVHRSALLALVFASAAGGCAPPVADESEPPSEFDDFVEKAGTLSCTARQNTGYASGRAFSIEVLTVDGKPVEGETAEAYWKMQQAAEREGVRLRVVSGFRTQAEQQYLYGCYVHCDCNGCNLAAQPGYSNHQSGSALDLNTAESGVYSWLSRNGARFGFARTVPSESWHWEYLGGGASGAWPCDGGEGDGLSEPPTGGASPTDTYTVGWGGSCWEAGRALGCGTESLVNCTAAERGCDTLWSGDRLSCGESGCTVAAPPVGRARPAKFRVPRGGTCDEAARALGCSVAALHNCTAPESGCAQLWADDLLACRPADCR